MRNRSRYLAISGWLDPKNCIKPMHISMISGLGGPLFPNWGVVNSSSLHWGVFVGVDFTDTAPWIAVGFGQILHGFTWRTAWNIHIHLVFHAIPRKFQSSFTVTVTPMIRWLGFNFGVSIRCRFFPWLRLLTALITQVWALISALFIRRFCTGLWLCRDPQLGGIPNAWETWEKWLNGP